MTHHRCAALDYCGQEKAACGRSTLARLGVPLGAPAAAWLLPRGSLAPHTMAARGRLNVGASEQLLDRRHAARPRHRHQQRKAPTL
jgi:hypothetical protein